MTNGQQLLAIIYAWSIPSLLLLIGLQLNRIANELRRSRKQSEQTEQLLRLCTRTVDNVPERPK